MPAESPILAVRIVIAGPGRPSEELVYDRFPIRLGRNPLNELPLDDAHVSQWHAIIGHVEGTLRIIDVGSRNGTMIAGRRLSGGQAVPIRGGEQIEIGPFTLKVEPAQGPVQPSSRPPRTATPAGTAIGGITISYDKERRATGPASSEIAAAREADLKERLKPLYLAFLRDWATLCDAVRVQAKTLPEPERLAMLARLRADFPAHHWEDEFPELQAQARASASAPSSGDAGSEALAALNQLAGRFLRRKQPLVTAGDVRVFTGRLGEVLDVFIEHTHNLLKGFQRLESDMALKVLGREANPIDRARDARDLAARLLDFTAEGADRAPGWLASAFKNVMVQQVALLSGAMEGVRTLLATLAPEKIEEELREGGQLGAFTMRAKALWNRYVEKHQKLSEEDQETFEAIFGKQLSKAYVELTGEGYAEAGSRRSRN